MLSHFTYFSLLLPWYILLAFIADAQLLWPWERAAKLMGDFKNLPLLEHGKQCSNPDLLRNTYLENLLEVPYQDLQDVTVVESIMVYNRWVKYGGYRCEPSKYQCRQIPNGELWTCQCPNTVGKQVTTEVKDATGRVTGCKFQSTPVYSTQMTPNIGACANVKNQYSTLLPTSYEDEIVCGIYIEDNVTVSQNASKILSIESGLHFNKIDCPEPGQKCLMKEFNSECTVENIQQLRNNWIYSPELNRFNRLPDWPPCTCSSEAEQPFPDEDIREKAIDQLFATLPQGRLGKSCDTADFDLMKTCARGNWYLFPETQLDKFKQLLGDYQSAGTSVCDQSRGLICSSNKVCECDKTPLLPGWSPERPEKVNDDGHCELDPGSDCTVVPSDPGYAFGCPKSRNCLIDKYNVICNKANLDKAKKKNEKFLNRCLCSAEKVETELKDLDNPKKTSVGIHINSEKSVVFTVILVTVSNSIFN